MLVAEDPFETVKCRTTLKIVVLLESMSKCNVEYNHMSINIHIFPYHFKSLLRHIVPTISIISDILLSFVNQKKANEQHRLISVSW